MVEYRTRNREVACSSSLPVNTGTGNNITTIALLIANAADILATDTTDERNRNLTQF